MKKENWQIIGALVAVLLMVLLVFNVENVTNFLTGILGEKGTNNLLMGILGLMFLGMIVWIGIAFVKMIKNERKASKF